MIARNSYILVIMLFVALFTYQCSETVSNNENAFSVTEESILKIPGYDWYPVVKRQYYPDSGVVSDIIKEFDSTKHRFIIFSKPACACEDEQKLFPRAMKVLDTAGISSEYYELYSVKSNKTNHPYDSIISLNFVPSMILLVNGKPAYSIIDSVYDKSITTYSIESEILKALRK